MTTPVEIDLNCPNCRDVFKTTSWLSTNTFGPRTTDFYQKARGFQPLPLSIHSCPNCGYSGYEDDFANVSLDKRVSDLIAQRLTPLIKDEVAYGGRRYEYAAWIATWRGASSIEIGHLYHRAAWCCYDDGREEEERYYRRQAIEHFERALDKGEIPEARLAVYIYLIGELYRRISERENARIWFERVSDAAESDPEMQWIVALAHQQETNPKEYFE